MALFVQFVIHNSILFNLQVLLYLLNHLYHLSRFLIYPLSSLQVPDPLSYFPSLFSFMKVPDSLPHFKHFTNLLMSPHQSCRFLTPDSIPTNLTGFWYLILSQQISDAIPYITPSSHLFPIHTSSISLSQPL